MTLEVVFIFTIALSAWSTFCFWLGRRHERDLGAHGPVVLFYASNAARRELTDRREHRLN